MGEATAATGLDWGRAKMDPEEGREPDCQEDVWGEKLGLLRPPFCWCSRLAPPRQASLRSSFISPFSFYDLLSSTGARLLSITWILSTL